MADKDKTVFGQSLPTSPSRQGQQPPAPQQPPAAAPPPPQAQPPARNPGGAEKTVFGAQLPQPGGRVAPTGGQPPAPQAPAAPPPPAGGPPPGVEDTWLGGSLNPSAYGMPAPAQPAAPPPPQNYGQPAQGGFQHPQHYTPQTGGGPVGAEMFPDIPDPAQQAAQQPRQVPRIALEDALRGTGLGAGGPTNPLVAAAANLLILLGRLRSGVVEMQVQPLIEHVAREIDVFERNALAAGVAPGDVTDAKYALSATADDIVQNLPGADKAVWLQYSMVARFFNERSSGVGFFQKMDAAMKAPAQRFHLLEMMLTCLSLGFEGQYRSAPNGSVDLARIRTAIYETLRRVTPRPDDDVSVRWEPVILGGRRSYGGVPIWIIGAVAAAMVVALFATLSTLLAGEGAEAQEEILALHRNTPPITIERTLPVEQVVEYVAPETTQFERITTALQAEIDAGTLEVEPKGEYILVRLGSALQFASGSADLTNEDEVNALAAAIGRALDTEEGPLRVVGHTDSIPPSGRGRYKTNEELSVARAETVAAILVQYFADPNRIAPEGVGAIDPIADNETREGRATNRRVEVLIRKEDI